MEEKILLDRLYHAAARYFRLMEGELDLCFAEREEVRSRMFSALIDVKLSCYSTPGEWHNAGVVHFTLGSSEPSVYELPPEEEQ